MSSLTPRLDLGIHRKAKDLAGWISPSKYTNGAGNRFRPQDTLARTLDVLELTENNIYAYRKAGT